jgi:hypothetical protein
MRSTKNYSYSLKTPPANLTDSFHPIHKIRKVNRGNQIISSMQPVVVEILQWVVNRINKHSCHLIDLKQNLLVSDHHLSSQINYFNLLHKKEIKASSESTRFPSISSSKINLLTQMTVIIQLPVETNTDR